MGMTRRTLLGVLSCAVAALGGCSDGGTGDGVAGTPTAKPMLDPPPVSIDADFEAASGTVELTLSGSRGIDAENTAEVYVEVDDERRSTWFDDDEAEALRPGDTVRVSDVRSGQELDVMWVPQDGERSALLWSTTVGE